MNKICHLLLAVTVSQVALASTQPKRWYRVDSYSYKSVYHEKIPNRFVGKYTESARGLKSTFSIDSVGHIKGEFMRKGLIQKWQGAVYMMGSNAANSRRLIGKYIISRTSMKKLPVSIKKSMDSPGTIIVTNSPDQSAKTVHQYQVDFIGHFYNYIAFNQIYNFVAKK